MFLGGRLRGPVRSELVHDRVGPSERATVISVRSLPLLADAWSVPTAWLLFGPLLAASAALFIGVSAGSNRASVDPGRPEELRPAVGPRRTK